MFNYETRQCDEKKCFNEINSFIFIFILHFHKKNLLGMVQANARHLAMDFWKNINLDVKKQ